ncbi:MAG: hypothetical protein V1717_00885 [Candidatus Micrarchaeota archaeon]
MDVSRKIILLLVPVLILSMLPLIFADYIQTEVIFTVGANTGFIVTLPGGVLGANDVNSTNSSSSTNYTTSQIEFNSSGATSTNVQPCVVAGLCQTNVQPIFNYTNIGNTNISIGVFFNASYACGGGTLTVQVNCTKAGYGTGCVGQPQVGVSEATITQVMQNLTPSNWTNYVHTWMWANFTSCVAGQYRNWVYHRSNATT